MARSFGRIYTRVWADPAWRELDVDAQHLYVVLISQTSMNLAGVLPLQVRKWAGCAADWDTERVRAALDRLASDRFVLVSEDTEEVLVRSLIRNDEAYKTPGILKSILKSAEATQGPELRCALAVELGRLDPLEGKKAAEGTALITAARLALMPNGTPPPGGLIHRPDGIGDGITDGIGDAIGDTFLGTHRGYLPQSSTEPIADTSVSVSVSVPRLSLVGSVVGGSPPAPTDEPSKCKRHDGMAREDIPNCGACQRLRVRWEDERAQVASLIAAEAAKPKPTCPLHPGQIAAFCSPCRSERLEAGT